MTIIIGGGREDNAMLHLSHAACDLCNVAVVAEIACNKCDIAAMSQRLHQCCRDCSNVAFVACNCSDVAFVAYDKCGIAEIANLEVYECPEFLKIHRAERYDVRTKILDSCPRDILS